MKKRFLFLSGMLALQTYYAHAQTQPSYSATEATTQTGNYHYKLFNGSGANTALRWTIGMIETESGSNKGSNFRISRIDDNGNWIASALAIDRSTGLVEMYGGFRANSTAAGQPALTGAGITGTGTGIANTSVLGFYESNAKTRQGMVGKYVNNSNDMFLVSEIGGIRLSPMGDGAVHISGNGVRNVMDFYQAEYGAPTAETRSIGTRLVLHSRVAAGSPATDYALGLQLGATVTGWFSVPSNTETHYWDFYGGTVPVVRLDGAGNITTKGTLTLNNTTSNLIKFAPGGVGAPTFNTRSLGTKIVLHDAVGSAPTNMDYAIGLERGATTYGWFAVPTNTTGHGWNFYGGTTLVANLDGVGNFSTSGNMVVGNTTAQVTMKVNGEISTRKVKVTTTGWPDFVFTDDYKLPSLQEISRYIKENHRLPGVPAAAEVEKSGLDVGEMQKTMMEKIEQLTLHLIRLDEENRQLKEELEKLKASK
ncbi:hypothetical protein SAMN05428949_0382 [Chitinophaga sp. YR627]|uniref:hypothetical protein n=1 Tax=Chitinophaga sp. YR627 TaxID=1881041 RepID=UPI0008F2F658|nr:hypothetical protein [Chitinophaga sp. YR627]SFM67124.1 hypothetical protein SAMN05428949_0382 [Chitinophaga sp. YR627]